MCFNICIKQIECGESHTHLLSKDGSLYSMGSNQFGQLGLGFSADVVSNVELPTYVKSDVKFCSVSCGMSHSVALDKQGTCYGWGLSDQGAIGTRITTSNEPSEI